VDDLQATFTTFLLSLTCTNDPLPLPAHHLTFLPMTSKGGLNFHNRSKAAIPALLVPLICSIHYAAQGIPYWESDKVHTKLSPIYSKWFSTWKIAQHPPKIIHNLHHYLPALLEGYNEDLFTNQHSLVSPELVLHTPPMTFKVNSTTT
jgi:hypothetical protein